MLQRSSPAMRLATWLFLALEATWLGTWLAAATQKAY
jgi:hypothetical protein